MNTQELRDLVAQEPKLTNFFTSLRFVLDKAVSFESLISNLETRLADLGLEVEKAQKQLDRYNGLTEQAAVDAKFKVDEYEAQAAQALEKARDAKEELESFKRVAAIEHTKITESLSGKRQELVNLEARVGEAKATLAKLKGI